MRRTAVGIMLAGFVFIFIRLDILGIDVDLLIDAVGFLLLFNGIRALGRIDRAEYEGRGPGAALPPASYGFGAAWPLAVALVVVSALQLFLTWGVPMVALSLARAGLEILFFFFLLRGFTPLLCRQGRPALLRSVQAVLALDLAASALTPLPGFFASGAFADFVAGIGLGVHLLTLVVFIWLLVKISDGAMEGKGKKN